MIKLWRVTVNEWGWNRPKTYYARSRKEAEDIAEEYSVSDPVVYAGNYTEINANQLLEHTYYR